MYPHGTIYHIYDPKKSGRHGEVVLHAPLKVRFLYSVLRGLGSGLIGFAIISLLFAYGPIIKEEISYNLGLSQIETSYKTEADDLMKLAEAQRVEEVRREAQELGVSPYFSIVIPKIGAKAQIIANVDAAEEDEYSKALKEGVAHAKGTYFPGQGKNMFLFAHSTNGEWNITRYNAIFYLLRKLDEGDKIIVFFADNKYEYTVEKKVVTNAKDTSWLTEKGQGEQLVLQTCDPPGTTTNRLLVIARP